jgi:hypothetical protein
VHVPVRAASKPRSAWRARIMREPAWLTVFSVSMRPDGAVTRAPKPKRAQNQSPGTFVPGLDIHVMRPAITP